LAFDILYDVVYEYKLLETDTDVENMFAEQEFEVEPLFLYVIFKFVSLIQFNVLSLIFNEIIFHDIHFSCNVSIVWLTFLYSLHDWIGAKLRTFVRGLITSVVGYFKPCIVYGVSSMLYVAKFLSLKYPEVYFYE
jgi:hypothetical protein